MSADKRTSKYPNRPEQAELKENAWKLFERAQVRMERVRRIQCGTIIPATRGLPNVMARDSEGRWWPNSNFVADSNFVKEN